MEKQTENRMICSHAKDSVLHKYEIEMKTDFFLSLSFSIFRIFIVNFFLLFFSFLLLLKETKPTKNLVFTLANI